MGFWRALFGPIKAPQAPPRQPLPAFTPGLLLSASPLVEDGKVFLKRNGQIVGYGSISELETAKDEVFDELVLSLSDFHAVRERAGGPIP